MDCRANTSDELKAAYLTAYGTGVKGVYQEPAFFVYETKSEIVFRLVIGCA
jgi:hypothetical protein